MTTVISVTPTRIVWGCRVCGRPVTKGTGYVGVDEFAAYEAFRQWEEWEAARRREHPPEALVAYKASEFPQTDMASWWALHEACVDEEPPGSYSFGVERADTPLKFLHWAGHLMEKNWIQHTDLSSLCQRIGQDA